MPQNNNKRYSELDKKYITENYKKMSDKKMSEIIGLSASTICRKRIELGLRIQKREEFIIGGYYQKYINKKKVWVHRYNAEKKIGRKLLSTEPVHHIDGNKTNNDYDNLYICESKEKHGLVHGSLEKVAFELYRNGYIKFNEDTGEYYISEQIRTEG